MAGPLALQRRQPDDTLAVRFIAEDQQPAAEIAELIAEFIAAAKTDLLIALYDCRLDETAARPIREALRDRLDRGVSVRVIYDNSFRKPQNYGDFEQVGGDFAETMTHERVAELGLPDDTLRGIEGEGLMHQKFIVRDGETVWTGSMNWTNDSMSRMENTLVALDSSQIAELFRRDFEQLWQSRRTLESGSFRTDAVALAYGGQRADADVDFSPGQGEHINEWVARRIRDAQRRIIFCSMLINSSKVLGALMEVLDQRRLELWGVYDRTQMEGVLHQWAGQPHVQWKVDAIHRLLREAEMVGKDSLPYRPGHSHNFMHNKLLIVDDAVITGSYNLSHAAQANAENMLSIVSPLMAEDAIAYVTGLRNRFLESDAQRAESDSQRPNVNRDR
jgi:phosphatidylserine/phosphatidylglycerophosphate/cardiolipin synthase-like enzyme